MKKNTLLIVFICLSGFFVAIYLLKTYGVVKVDAPSTAPAIEESVTTVNQPNPTPIPPTENLTIPEVLPSSDNAYLRLVGHGEVNASAGVITIKYNDMDKISISIEKSALDVPLTVTNGSTSIVELVFSRFDPMLSLQDNIDKYLNTAFINYNPDNK